FLRVAREGSVPETLARLVAEELGGKTVRVAIAHSDAKPEWLEGLKRGLESALRLERGRVTRSGGTIAANVGLGALAVHAYALEEPLALRGRGGMEIALERIYGHRLALPQVGAALLFSQEVPPALLLAPEARLRRYRDLSAFGARVYV